MSWMPLKHHLWKQRISLCCLTAELCTQHTDKTLSYPSNMWQSVESFPGGTALFCAWHLAIADGHTKTMIRQIFAQHEELSIGKLPGITSSMFHAAWDAQAEAMKIATSDHSQSIKGNLPLWEFHLLTVSSICHGSSIDLEVQGSAFVYLNLLKYWWSSWCKPGHTHPIFQGI